MDNVLLRESPVATMEMLQADFIMEQCVSRPPEKVLIMPSASSATDKASTPSPPANSKKPGRGRSSLLSIISGGENKSPRPSVSSISEEPLSPSPCASPNASLAPISSPKKSSPSTLDINNKTAETVKDNPTVKDKPAKKVPPPTKAKPSKRSSSTTATSPSPTACTAAAALTMENTANVKASGSLSPKEGVLVNEPALSSNAAGEEVCSVNLPDVSSDTSETREQFITPKTASIHNKAADVMTNSNVDVNGIIATDVENEGTCSSTEEPSTVYNDSSTPATVDADLSTVDADLSTVDADLPLPIPPDMSTEADECDNIEFPPPPPETEFLENMELPAEPPTEDIGSPTQTTIELFPSEHNSDEQEAVTKIMSKYDVSPVAVNNNNTQLHNNYVTKDAVLDPCKQNISTNEVCSDSAGIPSDNSSPTHAIIAEANTVDSQLVTKEVDDLTEASRILEEATERLNLELASTEEVHESTNVSGISDKEPSNSSALSSNIPANAELELSTENDLNSSETHDIKMLADDSEVFDSAALPPPPPSILELDESPPGFSDFPEPYEGGNLDAESPSPINVALTDDGLTVAQHLDDSSGVSASTSPGAHSPPFNTSSESGDSGVEVGTSSLVGETVTVKLRPTTNDNRKSESAVPMFERNSTELKRVTFREGSNQANPTVVSSPKTAAEEQKIKRTGLSDDDVSQAEHFYKGHKTEVMACPCLATLYFAESYTSENISMESWKPEQIGIPVLIFDTGNGKRSCGLTMVFAEKGTGFSLWRTTINYESRWEVVEPVFHQMRIKGETFAGIAFQDEQSAKSFYNFFKTCTSDPEKNVLNNPHLRNTRKSKKDKKKSVKQKPSPLPTKSAISKPCEFTHVTQLKQSEDGLMAQAMVPAEEDEHGAEDKSVKFQ